MYIPYKVREFFDIKYQLRKIKWAYQRVSRGYSDRDLWGFDSYLSGVISKGMRQLAVDHHGCPHELYNKKKVGHECDKWGKILLEIAHGFEAKENLLNHEVYDMSEADNIMEESLIGSLNKESAYSKKCHEIWASKEYKKAVKDAEKKWEKGITLFKQYYNNFWD